MVDLPDVQKSEEGFVKKSIEKVGVRGIIVPMKVKKKEGGHQEVTAKISSYCNLVENLKGINMSRIGRTINECLSNSDDGFEELSKFTAKLKDAHGTSDVYIKCEFDYIINKKSPMTQLSTHEPVIVVFENYIKNNKETQLLTLKVAGMSLCPCSKEMSLLTNNINDDELEEIEGLSDDLKVKIKRSGFGAHNQNSVIEATVEIIKGNILWIEDLYDLCSSCFSSPTFNILKRPDEKYITEVSYMSGHYDDGKFQQVDGYGAKFVEDIAREVSDKLDVFIDDSISDYVIVVNNDESIHKEDIKATAVITAGRNLN